MDEQIARRASAELGQVTEDGPSGSPRVAGSLTAPAAMLAAILSVLAAVLGFWLDIYYGTAPRFGAGVPASRSRQFHSAKNLAVFPFSLRSLPKRAKVGARERLCFIGRRGLSLIHI